MLLVLVIVCMCIGQKIEVPSKTTAPEIAPPTTPPSTTSPPTTPPPLIYHISVSIRCDSGLSDDEIITILSQYMTLKLPCAYVFGCPEVGMICEGYATEENLRQILKLDFVSNVEII